MNATGIYLVVSRNVRTMMAVTAVNATVASGLTPPTDRNVMVRITFSKIIDYIEMDAIYD